MKLNPPETAPRDGSLFLARFARRTRLVPAMLVLKEDFPARWVEAKYDDYGFYNQPYDESDLTGWLPMPQIDKEGDVT